MGENEVEHIKSYQVETLEISLDVDVDVVVVVIAVIPYNVRRWNRLGSRFAFFLSYSSLKLESSIQIEIFATIHAIDV